MSPVVAALVLLSAIVLMLAFALAGLQQRIRALEARRINPTSSGDDEVAAAVARVAPSDGRLLSAVLMVERSCGVCADVMPDFVAAHRRLSGSVDFVVVSDGAPAYPAEGPRMVEDHVAHQALETGWFPALLVVSSEHEILSADPVGSADAIAHALGRVEARAVRR